MTLSTTLEVTLDRTPEETIGTTLEMTLGTTPKVKLTYIQGDFFDWSYLKR